MGQCHRQNLRQRNRNNSDLLSTLVAAKRYFPLRPPFLFHPKTAVISCTGKSRVNMIGFLRAGNISFSRKPLVKVWRTPPVQIVAQQFLLSRWLYCAAAEREKPVLQLEKSNRGDVSSWFCACYDTVCGLASAIMFYSRRRGGLVLSKWKGQWFAVAR